MLESENSKKFLATSTPTMLGSPDPSNIKLVVTALFLERKAFEYIKKPYCFSLCMRFQILALRPPLGGGGGASERPPNPSSVSLTSHAVRASLFHLYHIIFFSPPPPPPQLFWCRRACYVLTKSVTKN